MFFAFDNRKLATIKKRYCNAEIKNNQVNYFWLICVRTRNLRFNSHSRKGIMDLGGGSHLVFGICVGIEGTGAQAWGGGQYFLVYVH